MGEMIQVDFQKQRETTYEKVLNILDENYFKIDLYYLNIPLKALNDLEKHYQVTFIGVTVVEETRKLWQEKLGIVIESAYLPLPR